MDAASEELAQIIHIWRMQAVKTVKIRISAPYTDNSWVYKGDPLMQQNDSTNILSD